MATDTLAREAALSDVCNVLERASWTVEKRAPRRVNFSGLAEIAPLRDNSEPDALQFSAVRCRDLSCGGFSYYADAPPDFEHAVVRFPKRSRTIHLLARIVHHVQPIRTSSEYLIGCQFLSKLLPPE